MPCCICMIVHVSPAMQSYNETLQMIQLAAKFHRIDLRKKSKVRETRGVFLSVGDQQDRIC